MGGGHGGGGGGGGGGGMPNGFDGFSYSYHGDPRATFQQFFGKLNSWLELELRIEIIDVRTICSYSLYFVAVLQ